MRLGYALSSEEHAPADLVRNARRAEEAGLKFAPISDHFHPWIGELVSHRGKHYTVENARLYTTPDEPPPRVVAAAGPKSADIAARLGDGIVGVSPDEEMIGAFEESGGSGPRYGQVQVCWPPDEQGAKETALKWFPNIALLGEDEMADIVACGPDPERHVGMIRRFADAGFDHLYIHQIGPEQEGAIDFYAREVLPRLDS